MKRGKLIIASSHECADLLYVTGFIATDPFVYFSVEGDVAGIVVSALELERARQQVKEGITVFDINDILPEATDKSLKEIAKGIVEKYPADIWDVPSSFPLVYADFLDSIGVKYHCVEGGFFPERRTKTPDELKYLYDAVKLTEKAMHRAESIIREATIRKDGSLSWQGEVLTSEIVKREISVEIVRGGGAAYGTIVASGKESAEPHNVGSGSIKAGQPIVVDIFPRIEANGYWGDLTRTFVKGRAPDIVKTAYDAVKKARDFAKQNIRAGIDSSKLYRNVSSFLEEQSFKTGKSKEGSYFGFFHGLSHGIGLEIHENPFVRSTVKDVLRVNDVITVEPGVYYSEWGGVRLEDIVVVKENGIECFTEYPDNLEVM